MLKILPTNKTGASGTPNSKEVRPNITGVKSKSSCSAESMTVFGWRASCFSLLLWCSGSHTHAHSLTYLAPTAKETNAALFTSVWVFKTMPWCNLATPLEFRKWEKWKGKLGSNRGSFSLLPCRSASSRNGESCADRISILSRGVEQTLPITPE